MSSEITRPGSGGRRVVLAMTWRDLLFAHWPMPPDALRPLIPPPLELDLFDGEAWLGIVPFRMTHVRPLGLPLPGEAFAFAEVNVRTYVRGPHGTAGVWFLSLDGQHRAGAAAARLAFGVPYRYARVTSRIDDGWIRFASRHDGSPPAELRASFRPVGPVRHAAPGSLEAFLTNRLTLFARRGGQVWRGDIHHGPWPLQDAELEVERDTMASSHGLSLPATPPVLQFAGRLETVAYRPVPIG